MAGKLTGWLDVPGFEGMYQASDTGLVKSLPRLRRGFKGTPTAVRERILKPHTGANGYPTVVLCNNGKKRAMHLHRIVALTFLDLILGRDEVNHIDGDKSNNAASNLEWVTRSGNVKHSYTIHGSRKKVG